MADTSITTLTKPAAGGMDGMSQIAAAIPVNDPAHILAQQEAAEGTRLQQHLDTDEAQLSHLDAAQQATWQMMQRQRLITVNKAQVLRKVLPVIGLFTLIAGKVGGMDSALAALGGGMAGLTKGLDQQMQDAWQQYTASYNQMMARLNETQAQIKAVIDDREKTQAQKIDLFNALGSQVAAYRLAISKANTDENRLEIAQMRNSEQEATSFAHNAILMAIANTHAQVEQQAKTVQQQKQLADVAMKAPTVGDMKIALGALFGSPDASAVKEASALAGDSLLGGGKVDPFAGYDTNQQSEARQLLSQTNVYIAQHPEVPRDLAMQRVQAGLFQQGLSNVSSLKLPHERPSSSGGKKMTAAEVNDFVAKHPAWSRQQAIDALKAKGYVIIP